MYRNALDPDHMTVDERLDEVADILAIGLIRLRARKSRQLSSDRGDSCLDFPAPRSRHETVKIKTENNR